MKCSSCDPTTPTLDSTTPPSSRNVAQDVIVTGSASAVTVTDGLGRSSAKVRHSGRSVVDARSNRLSASPIRTVSVPAPGRAVAHSTNLSKLWLPSDVSDIDAPACMEVRLNPATPIGGRGCADPAPNDALTRHPADIAAVTPRVR